MREWHNTVPNIIISHWSGNSYVYVGCVKGSVAPPSWIVVLRHHARREKGESPLGSPYWARAWWTFKTLDEKSCIEAAAEWTPNPPFRRFWIAKGVNSALVGGLVSCWLAIENTCPWPAQSIGGAFTWPWNAGVHSDLSGLKRTIGHSIKIETSPFEIEHSKYKLHTKWDP